MGCNPKVGSVDMHCFGLVWSDFGFGIDRIIINDGIFGEYLLSSPFPVFWTSMDAGRRINNVAMKSNVEGYVRRQKNVLMSPNKKSTSRAVPNKRCSRANPNRPENFEEIRSTLCSLEILAV